MSNKHNSKLYNTHMKTTVLQTNDYIKGLQIFNERFKNIGEIEKGDKIGKNADNDKYIIYKGGKLQKLWRWLYSEDRKTTFGYFDKDFKEFFGYCDSIKNKHTGFAPTKKIEEILMNIINNVITGLYCLKESYNNHPNDGGEKLCCKIDSIILTLIDMKQEINKKDPPSLPQMIHINKKNPSTSLMTSVSF